MEKWGFYQNILKWGWFPPSTPPNNFALSTTFALSGLAVSTLQCVEQFRSPPCKKPLLHLSEATSRTTGITLQVFPLCTSQAKLLPAAASWVSATGTCKRILLCLFFVFSLHKLVLFLLCFILTWCINVKKIVAVYFMYNGVSPHKPTAAIFKDDGLLYFLLRHCI